MKKKNIILFDLDGTLIDSVPDLALSVNEMLQNIGRQPFSVDIVRNWVGNGAETLVKRALSGSREIDPKLDEALVAKALSIFLEAYAKNLCVDTVLFEGVKTTLHALKQKGYRKVIVTNKPHRFVEPLLKELGVNGYFELILGGDSLPQKKPDPAPLLHVCKTLGVDAKACVMVGDSKNDILAAKAADMESIAVSYGYNYDEDISSYAPDIIVEDFSALTDALESLHG